ncbi:unnamed protein product, partial [Ectocarpus sp. 13 AM-2016]
FTRSPLTLPILVRALILRCSTRSLETMTSSYWTPNRNELVGKLVRRFAFDFDAVSNAFRNHLQREGVNLKSEETAPAALRKVYASLDR